MVNDLELLTTPEAAVVAGVSVRDVNRLIDEHILPEGLYSNERNRRVRSGACVLVRFYYGSASALTADERKYAILHLWDEAKENDDLWTIRTWRRAKPRWTIRHRFLTVNFDDFVSETIKGHDELAEARSIVVQDENILGGIPVIKGTRIPVFDVASSAGAGIPLSRIKEAYPRLSERQIELAVVYAKATPVHGRPRTIKPGKDATTRKVMRARGR